jgi:glutamate formiminotransferase/formiminotetrahydrofolate cyclodeaminase
MVKREAEQFGVKVTRAELIGMIPEQALLDAAKWYLQLNDIDEDQVLELRLAKEQASDFTPYHFLDATAAGTPTPGGGSTAALAGALAASLSMMVANLTSGRKKYAAVDEQSSRILTEAGNLRQNLTAAILEDSRAFEQVMAAFRDKDKDQASRATAIEQATIYAGEVPLSVAELSTEVARLAQEIVSIGNTNAITDAGAGAIMARSAVQIAALNVRVNARSLNDQGLATQWIARLEQLEATVEKITEETLRKVAERGDF